MIYLFAGEDTKKKISAYENFLKSQPKGEEVFNIDRKDFDQMAVESLYSGNGLFFSKCRVIFNNVFESEEVKSFLIKNLSKMFDSANTFIFLEGKINKATMDAFKEARAELNIFEQRAHIERFDNFLLANAFYAKDKLNLWIYFRQAMDLGVGMEELVGVLFWKIKDMILKKNFGKFKESELKEVARKLAYLLPEARKKGRDAEALFEVFLLEAF